MRFYPLFAASVLLFLSAPAGAQTALSAPSGWKTQVRAGGATTFVPPELGAGEVYSVTAYDSAPLEGKVLAEWLRTFAGPVGKTAGTLGGPLQIKVSQGQIVSGTGVYSGPNGTMLGVVFLGVCLDGGASIHVSRTLFSSPKLLERYSAENTAIMRGLVVRARAEAGSNLHTTPPRVLTHLTPGGALVPGIYAGNQYSGKELQFRLHLHIYPTGEYRLTDQNDQDLRRRFFDEEVGDVSYNRNTGQLTAGYMYSFVNSRSDSDRDFCYFGRDKDGKPAIYAEEDKGFDTSITSLTYIGPPEKRLSKSQESERRDAAEAEKRRFKWVTAPGKGVPNAAIATILLDLKTNGMSNDETVYLLLRDGTVYADLPVPPDELDIVRSRQKEPGKWGRWRQAKGGYSVSWEGAPYQSLPGSRVVAAPAQVHLQGRWGTGQSSPGIMNASWSLWGVTFSREGRFRKDSRGGSSSGMGAIDGSGIPQIFSTYDDEGSVTSASGDSFFVASQSKKKNPNGNREGDYSINGYVLTLHYDNGRVKRLPFFFLDPAHNGLWFEGASLSRDTDKK